MKEIVDTLLSSAESSSKSRGKTAAATKTRTEQKQQATSKSEALPSMSELGLSTGPGSIMLTMGDFHHPAYLVNRKFEVEWANTAAEREIFGLRGSLPVDLTDRNLFSFFAAAARPSPGWDGVLQFHIGIGKKRLSKSALFSINVEGDADVVTKLGQYYDDVPATDPQPLLQCAVMLEFEDGAPRSYNLYVSFFREGIFFAYVPASEESDGLLNFLSRRDLVIRDLLQNRRPYLTPLAVLVADVQDSVKICAELPPEEYFELINHVWRSMAPLLRKYFGTYGKHVGDGMVYYFFPQPDCNYIYNALSCAHEMKEIMRGVSPKTADSQELGQRPAAQHRPRRGRGVVRHLPHPHPPRVHRARRHHQPQRPVKRFRPLWHGLGDQEHARKGLDQAAREHPLRHPTHPRQRRKSGNAAKLFADIQPDRPQRAAPRQVSGYRRPAVTEILDIERDADTGG